jgi:hypothetical protein
LNSSNVVSQPRCGQGEPRSASRSGANAILSPVGTRLVYLSQSKLFARRLDQATATELPGTERAQAPFFSPDGQGVAFFATGRLKKVSLRSGRVAAVCEVALGDGRQLGRGRQYRRGLRCTRFTDSLRRRYACAHDGSGPGRDGPSLAPDGATVEVLSWRDGRRKTLVRPPGLYQQRYALCDSF